MRGFHAIDFSINFIMMLRLMSATAPVQTTYQLAPHETSSAFQPRCLPLPLGRSAQSPAHFTLPLTRFATGLALIQRHHDAFSRASLAPRALILPAGAKTAYGVILRLPNIYASARLHHHHGTADISH
jgi:hypothetical protein